MPDIPQLYIYKCIQLLSLTATNFSPPIHPTNYYHIAYVYGTALTVLPSLKTFQHQKSLAGLQDFYNE